MSAASTRDRFSVGGGFFDDSTNATRFGLWSHTVQSRSVFFFTWASFCARQHQFVSWRLLPFEYGGDALLGSPAIDLDRHDQSNRSELRRSGVSESLGRPLGRPQAGPWAQGEVSEACG